MSEISPTDAELEAAIESAIRYELMTQAVSLAHCRAGELSMREVIVEFSHYRQDVFDWQLGDPVPIWAKEE